MRMRSGKAVWGGTLAMLLAVSCMPARAAAPVAPDLVRTAETPRVTATLAPELAVAAPGTRVDVILHQRIIDGWHTYWENPGDSGQPIDVAWTLPDGVTAGPLRYPVPEPIRVGPLMNHGYSKETAVLAGLAIPGDWPAGRPVPVQAHATWLVCEEVCIPEEARFAFSLPTGDAPVALEPVRELFARARAALPAPAPWPVSVRDEGSHLVLSVDAAGVDLAGAWFFAREWGHLAHAADQQARKVDGRAELVLAKGELPPGGTLDGVLRYGGKGHAGYSVTASIGGAAAAADVALRAPAAVAAAHAAVPAPAAAADPATLLLLALAFAGGVLLNLMPCVFPVLAVKAMGLVRHAAEPVRVRAAGGLAYAAGVLVSFAALAAVLLALKAGGEAVGWGFHLQSPGVVAALALVLFAVGLSLSGLLAIGGSWTGAGSGLAARPGLAGSFFTGVLAAVVAAPCTAPFMATAIGVALLQSAAVAMAVFLALGLGLAMPYLLLTCVPALSARLPRPGPWMERGKQLLAFPMYASAAWLVWVLAQQAGADAVGLVLLAMVALALAAWSWRAASGAARRGRRLGRALGGAAAAAALAAVIAAGGMPPPEPGTVPDADGMAERYDPARIQSVLAGGGAVFLNVTAAWCVTCKVNERLALSGDGFRRALAERGVTYMKGDWTRRDPRITALLERFGRAGVPLYVVFPRGGGAPRVLPQVLTDTIVREALAAA